jgi:hypothetical protein
MRFYEAFPTKHLSAKVDFGDGLDKILTIHDAQMERMGQGKQAEDKIVVYFSEIEKGLVLNKTNATTISKVCGSDDTDDWIGKRIAIFATETEFAGDQIECIRVRLKAPVAKKAAPPKPASKPAPALAVTDNDVEAGEAIDDEDIPF